MKFKLRIVLVVLCFISNSVLGNPFAIEPEYLRLDSYGGGVGDDPIMDIIFLICAIAAYAYLFSSYKQWEQRKITNDAPKAMNGASEWGPAIVGYLVVAVFISFPILLITKWIASAAFVRDIWYWVYIPSFLLLVYFRRSGTVNESRSFPLSSINVKDSPTANVINSNPKSYPVTIWHGLAGLVVLVVLALTLSPNNTPHEAESIPQPQLPEASTPSNVSTSNSSELAETPVVSAVSPQDATSIASGWMLVERFSNADVYADSSSISRTGDRVDMRSLVDYMTAVVDEQSDPYKSFVVLSSYDCRTSQIKVRGFRAYAQNMGRGGQVMAYSDPSSGWSVVTSQDVTRWRYACGKR